MKVLPACKFFVKYLNKLQHEKHIFQRRSKNFGHDCIINFIRTAINTIANGLFDISRVEDHVGNKRRLLTIRDGTGAHKWKCFDPAGVI